MFELPDLPFAANALEPHMSRDTLTTHHDKHHAAYVKKTNALLSKRKNVGSLEDVIRATDPASEAKLFNNAAQAWNHGFFWNCLTPKTQQGPSGALTHAIEKAFASVEKFRDAFLKQGEEHFASGWLWLTSDANGVLKLEALHDAMTPIAKDGATPILTCDLWEHAYYLDHKNERPAFLKAVYEHLLNWDFAERQYRAAIGDGPGWRYPAPHEPVKRATAG